MLEKHIDELLDLHRILRPYYNMEIGFNDHGSHYPLCPWSNDAADEGPDSCQCAIIEKTYMRANKLIKLYRRMIDV